MMVYNKDNIFYKIINKQINADIIYEDDYGIVIADINPAAKVHLLIIPKAEVLSFDDFVTQMPSKFVKGFFNIAPKMAAKYNLVSSGYRLITNHGNDASQTVMHFHMHLLGGESLGPISHKDGTHK